MLKRLKQTVFRWFAIHKLKHISNKELYRIIEKYVREVDFDEQVKSAFLKRLKESLK